MSLLLEHAGGADGHGQDGGDGGGARAEAVTCVPSGERAMSGRISGFG